MAPRPAVMTRAAAVLFVFCAVVSCIGTSRAKECSSNSECSTGFCGLRGFCTAECHADTECPCGAFCATACGICLRHDLAGPATCFAFRQGLSTADVLGVCRAAVEDAASPPINDAGLVEAGACNQPPLTLPQCIDSPPEADDGGKDGSVDASASATADTGFTADSGGDR